MDIRCLKCEELIPSKFFKDHCLFDHDERARYYRCPESSCHRTYTSYFSLYNHYRKQHRTLNYMNGIECDVNDDVQSAIRNDVGVMENHSDVITNRINDKFNYPSFFEDALKVAAKFYSNPKISNKHCEEIIRELDNVVNSDFLNYLKNFVMSHVDISVAGEISKLFGDFQSCFSRLNTKHKFTSEIKNFKGFVNSKKVTFGYREDSKSNILTHVKNTGNVFCLAEILQNFFEMPNVLDKTISYIEKLQSDTNISNIIQSKLWREKVENDGNKLTIPLFLYEDDFECGNALGSHATIQKMSGLYISIPCLPPQYRSKVENIFLFQISYSNDKEEYKSEVTYNEVIKQLNILATDGIKLNISNKSVQVFFKLALIVGDNLSLNTMLGFTKSFNSTHFCRFCRVSKSVSKTQNTANDSLLRDKQNYEADIEVNNVSETGIREICIWNNVVDFNVTNNLAVDIMHDLFEGVCKYDIGLILYNLIKVEKCITLYALNFKLKYFRYPKRCNRIVAITDAQINDKSIKMSASEMKCFILNLNVIIGDSINSKNNYWKLYVLLRKIVCIVLKPTINANDIQVLKTLIKKHHLLYIKLSNDSLKPKHHIMLHYPRIMQNVGPLVHLWSMRFEAKHQQLKSSALTSKNRINLPLTIATKQQYYISTLFLENDGFNSPVVCKKNGPPLHDSVMKCLSSVEIHSYTSLSYLCISNVKYNIGDVLKMDDNDYPKYGEILNIVELSLKHSDDKLKSAFIVKILECKNKNEHLQSYEVVQGNKVEIVYYESLLFMEPRNVVTISNDKRYIPYDNYMF